uniref:AA_permease_C domain-containing protein n=1 Tax=Ascaris lumbricoides TaxID=6252 RepID=A0A0M3IUC4_ASCLU
MLLAGRQITNDNISRRKCKTPIFPYLTLLVVFLTALLTCSANFITFVKVFTWTVVGYGLYFLYGLKHSKERNRSKSGIIIANDFTNDWNPKAAIMLRKTNGSIARYGLYFLYGLKHSKERNRSKSGIIIANDFTNDWNPKAAIMLRKTNGSIASSLF